MQTIPANLTPEELLNWYESTWNRLTNSEMEERLADALSAVLENNDSLEQIAKIEKELEDAQKKIIELKEQFDKILDLSSDISIICKEV